MAPPVPVSPLAPKVVPEMPPLAGLRFAAGAAGIKYKGRTDVMLALMPEGTEVAGVFTTSRCPSAPVEWCRRNLPHGRARVLVVNSGNANAFTGRLGEEAVALTASLAAAATGAAPDRGVPGLDRGDRRAPGCFQVRRRARTPRRASLARAGSWMPPGPS